MKMKRSTILNIKIDQRSKGDLNKFSSNALINSSKTDISFVNPEIILDATKNEMLNKYLNTITERNFIDGVGILIFKALFGNSMGPRNTGTDYMLELCKISEVENKKIFFLGGAPGVGENAKVKFKELHPNSNIVGVHHGYFSIDEESEIISKINSTGTDILVVCIGCPKQEEFIMRNLSLLNAKLILGNGGALDYYSGVVVRAPKLIQTIGFEWLWRLFQDFNQKRILRQLKLFEYSLKAFWSELLKKIKSWTEKLNYE